MVWLSDYGKAEGKGSILGIMSFRDIGRGDACGAVFQWHIFRQMEVHIITHSDYDLNMLDAIVETMR